MTWVGVARVIRTILAGLLLVAALSSAAQDEVSFTGTYRDEQISITFDPPSSSLAGRDCTGVIQMAERKFPLKGRQDGSRVTGTFESEGDEFSFAAQLVGRMLVFTTDGTTYRLRKQTANPLARAQTKPNPLATTRTNSPPSQTPAPAPQTLKGNALRLQRFSITDDPAMIGGEAFSMLIPADWQVVGGVTWRMHRVVPAFVTVRASNSNRTEVVEVFPSIPFVWAEGGIPLFPAGSNHMGNEVGQPIEDPLAYVQQVVLPRFRPNLTDPQLVATEELPRVAEVIAEAAQEPGTPKKFRAARMRLEYSENGRLMQEDIYCVMALASAPAVRATFWGADRNYSFKAEKGRLDARTKLFHSMVSSFRSNLNWFNRYVQLLHTLSQMQLDPTLPVSELARFVPGTTQDINDLRRQLFERQQANQERVNATFHQYVRGLEDYRDPFESRTVQLPAGYATIWANPTGEYLLADDPTYNPNTGTRRDWLKVEKDR